MTGKSALVYSEHLLKYDFGPFHPLKPERLVLTFELIKALDLLSEPDSYLCSPRTAQADEILLFHSLDHVKHVQDASGEGVGRLDLGDTPAFKGCYEASSLVVGATLEALDLIMMKGFEHAFNPAGGLHHAHRDHASGFCIFNDAAIGIAYLKNHYGLKRIMYLDIDAHHGDGVMYGFYSDPWLLNIDFHEDGRYIFPGTGHVSEIGEGAAKGFKINIPLPPLTSDEAFTYAFDRLVPSLARKLKPEFIIFQCGADAHAEDGLAHLNLTTAAYRHVTRVVHEIAHRFCLGRLVALGGGGYNLSNSTRCWSIVYGTLTGAPLNDEIPESWKARFESVTGDHPPSKLGDTPSQSQGMNGRGISRVVINTVQQIEAVIK